MYCSNFLIDHAIKKTYCEPAQDGSVIFKMTRLSGRYGARRFFNVLHRNYTLPDLESTWHIFTLGQYHPALINLFDDHERDPFVYWTSMMDVINKNKTVIMVHTPEGRILPSFEINYLFSYDNSLIIAIKDIHLSKIDLSASEFFLRIYDNSYLESTEAITNNIEFYSLGKQIKNNSDIIEFTQYYNEAKTKIGYTFVYSNGYRLDKLDPTTITVNDYVQLLHDGSVKHHVIFNERDLLSFISILDNKNKYLIHYPLNENNQINYHDDVDVYIGGLNSSGKFHSVYYHKGNEDAMRMVTHRDYSICVDYVRLYEDYLETNLPLIADEDAIKIELFVRKSGLTRPLPFEHARLHELYKLDDESIVQALIGTNSLVPAWNASNLEANEFSQIMRSENFLIDKNISRKAFGYNACSIALANTPSLVKEESNLRFIEVPLGLRDNTTAYEYDNQGKLLEYHHHNGYERYYVKNINTTTVELLNGLGYHYPQDSLGKDNIIINTYREYRIYLGYEYNGLVLSNNWEDITNTNKYIIDNDKVVWVDDPIDSKVLMVRYLDEYLDYTVSVKHHEGTMVIPIFTEIEFDGNIQLSPLLIPYGEMDVFLNGHSLIEHIDYSVKHPFISIYTKNYYIDPDELQQVHIRCRGFCNENLERELIDDYGFVVNGNLSNNNIYDIRDDKVMRVVVGGSLKLKEELTYSEFNDGTTTLNPLNGLPYMLRDHVIPMLKHVQTETYAYKKESEIRDNQISDYMTLYFDKIDKMDVNIINQRYTIFSPFINIIIHSLKNNVINENDINGQFLDDNTVITICEPYLSLLDYDPIMNEKIMMSRYIDIHPHHLNTTISLGLFQYRFLESVVRLYTQGRIKLSPFIQLI